MNNTNIILNPKRNIKINFSSFWSDFNIENNFITEILKKHFDITILLFSKNCFIITRG